jgi:hypothetical protein
MKRIPEIVLLLFLLCFQTRILAQAGESPLRTFGFFQNSFQHWTKLVDAPELNYFTVQQLNLMLQKDIAANWSAFVNFEVLNSFSSSRRWGGFNLEEAWAKYSPDVRFNLKLGLQIPIFNNLNEINNRTPLLPYIIRPIVYETSFGEFVAIENFVPQRAFAQTYGFFPAGEAKFDYAAYIGNSQSINDDPLNGPTGIDTTTTMLVGGRVGVRYQELKAGLSATYEKLNDFVDMAEDINQPVSVLEEWPSWRLGGDLSYNLANFSFEGEFITVNIEERVDEIKIDLDFWYSTLSYHVTDAFLVYGSYWFLKGDVTFRTVEDPLRNIEEISAPSAGIAYDINYRIRAKAQYTHVDIDEHVEFLIPGTIVPQDDKFNVLTFAVSVYF